MKFRRFPVILTWFFFKPKIKAKAPTCSACIALPPGKWFRDEAILLRRESFMTIQNGLSDQEAARQLKEDGYNELPSKKQRTVLHIVFEVIREPMFLLLIVAGSIYLALGDPGDAVMLLGFVFITMAITIFQERKTERVLETLRDLSSPRALVIRNGTQVRIPGREVVKGDLLALEEGDRVAADGVLVECHDLLIDESLL